MRDAVADGKSKLEGEVAIIAARIRSKLQPEMPDYYQYEDLTYLYRDPSTSRDFEVRQFERVDDTGLLRTQYFLHEYIPTGKMMKTNESGHVTHARDEPLVAHFEKTFGPNRLISELCSLGLDTALLVRSGGGRGPGSRYYDSLDDCAAAIATVLCQNARYQYFVPLTEQQKTRFEFQAAKTAHAYWLEQKRLHEQAIESCEEGLFKGCTGLFGAPLDKDCKKAILSYLNEPLSATWREVRDILVTGTGTLWQAWCAYDRNAPSYGDIGFPSPDILIAALHRAIEQRAQDIEAELVRLSPTGLRLVA